MMITMMIEMVGIEIREISGEEKEMKRGKRKGLITAGLATVATIHAAHNVYQSVEKREARRKAVKEGDITKEQATRMKNKNRMQDAASLGIAALGIKGAYSEWKEMKEHRGEMQERQEALARHREKREARRRKANKLAAEQYRANGYAGSMPNLHGAPDGQYDSGDVSPFSASTLQYPPQSTAHYQDDNPYASFSAAPAPAPTPPQPYLYEQHYNPQQYAPQQYAAQHYPPPPVGPVRTDTR